MYKRNATLLGQTYFLFIYFFMSLNVKKIRYMYKICDEKDSYINQKYTKQYILYLQTRKAYLPITHWLSSQDIQFKKG